MLKSFYLPFSTYIILGLATGIFLANFKLLLIILVLIIFVLLINKKVTKNQAYLLTASILLGHYLYHRQINIYHEFKNKINHKIFDVTGFVTSYEYTPGNLFRHKLTLKTNIFSNATEKFSRTKYLYLYAQKFPVAYIGDEILLNNLKFNFTTNQHFEHFLIKNNIAATVFTPNLNFKKKSNYPNNASIFDISNLLKKYKHNVLKKINLKMSSQTTTMFNSIFLGHKLCNKWQFNKLKQNFQTWGIVHYLARSGLHVVIISTIWQILCNLCQIPFALSNIFILLCMLLFCLLSWSALPFWRALIMITCYRICHFWHLPVHTLHILNTSCIVIILNNPISIFFLDFQLSFLLTYGLVFLNEISYMKKCLTPKHSIDYKK